MRIAVKHRALLIALLALPLQCARAQADYTGKSENGVTVYGGYRFGGGVTDSTTNSTIDLADGSSVAMSVDFGLDANRQIEIFFSRQHTAITSGAFSPQANNIGLTLYNYQIGGTNYIDELGRGVYVMGGIGGTTVKPDQSGLNSQSFFSGNLGIGWMLPLARNLGLRFEARGYAILLNNNGAIFCGGNRGCTVAINGSALFEGELLAGIAFRF
jgi:hypothetical protein